MIIETKKLWMKKIQVFLEDNIYNEKDLIRKYDSVVVLSHRKLDLPSFRLREKNTSLIDLTVLEEDMFKKFSDTTRNEIRRTYKNPDLNFRLNSDFNESYDLYSKFERSQGRKPVNKKEMKLFKVALAYYKNEPVYGFYIIETFPYSRIRSIFSKRLSVADKEVIKNISNSGRRLLWDICLDLKNRNFQFLDLASVNMENPKTVNIAKFKMSFGGNVVREYVYTHESNLFKKIAYFKKVF